MKTRTLSRQPTRHSPPPPLTLTSTSPPLHHRQTAPSRCLLPPRALRFKRHRHEVVFLRKALGIAPVPPHPRATFAVPETSGYTREKMLRFWRVAFLPLPSLADRLTSIPWTCTHAQITDALKTSENSTSPYIAYVIRSGVSSRHKILGKMLIVRSQTAEARHRYSEFESLRLNLTKLYPTLIIPPIPSKQTIGDYAIKQAKAREDTAMIARRKRMLQTFLNRIARHPILSNEHVFHRFLQGEVSWVCIFIIITRLSSGLISCWRRRRFCIRLLSPSSRKTLSRPLHTIRRIPTSHLLTRPCRIHLRLTLYVVRTNVSWIRRCSPTNSLRISAARWRR